MRRLVEAIEQYAANAAADRVAKEADQKREARATVAVIYALVSLIIVGSAQPVLIGQLVTQYWATLPVAIPVLALVAAFIYRAFRLRVFKEAQVYAVAGIVLLTSAIYLLTTPVLINRAAGVLFGIGGLRYFLGSLAATDSEAPDPGFQQIVHFLARNRLAQVALGIVLLVALIGVGWLLGSAMSIVQRVITLGIFLGAVVLVWVQRRFFPRLPS